MSYSSRTGSAVRHTPFQPASPVPSQVSRSSGCWSMPSYPDVSKVCSSHHPRRQTRGDLMELEDMVPSKCAAERHAGSNPAIPKRSKSDFDTHTDHLLVGFRLKCN